MNRHIEIVNGATDVVKHVERCTRSESLEVGDYLQAIEDLSTMHLGFKDVQMFLFKPKLNVLLSLVGLHYCIFRLNVPVTTTALAFTLLCQCFLCFILNGDKAQFEDFFFLTISFQWFYGT